MKYVIIPFDMVYLSAPDIVVDKIQSRESVCRLPTVQELADPAALEQRTALPLLALVANGPAYGNWRVQECTEAEAILDTVSKVADVREQCEQGTFVDQSQQCAAWRKARIARTFCEKLGFLGTIERQAAVQGFAAYWMDCVRREGGFYVGMQEHKSSSYIAHLVFSAIEATAGDEAPAYTEAIKPVFMHPSHTTPLAVDAAMVNRQGWRFVDDWNISNKQMRNTTNALLQQLGIDRDALSVDLLCASSDVLHGNLNGLPVRSYFSRPAPPPQRFEDHPSATGSHGRADFGAADLMRELCDPSPPLLANILTVYRDKEVNYPSQSPVAQAYRAEVAAYTARMNDWWSRKENQFRG